MTDELQAGAASVDITPTKSMFLHGYPHVERYSTGVHDPLLSSSLYLTDGRRQVIFIANDIVYVSKAMADRVRRRIAEATGVPASNIMVAATHTHSGPITVDCISHEDDPVVPKTDPEYLGFFADCMVDSAVKAHAAARPARLGLDLAHAVGVGTNRRDPAGPADPQVPVLLVRSADGDENIAAMVVYSMHPTVLHEDSTLISGDFPAMARQHLQAGVLGRDCPVLYFSGPCGNQSPRHVTKGNTLEEADRLGGLLGKAIEKAVGRIRFSSDVAIGACQEFVDLPRRTFPPVKQAEVNLKRAIDRLEGLRSSGAPSQEVRTAECDWFGAEETLTLARAAEDGRLAKSYEACLPAEVQIITIGSWAFVGWSGEVFVEYPLKVKAAQADAFIISLANGELGGYVVTPEAAAEGGYEASNALMAPESGDVLADKTLQMLAACRRGG